MIISKFTPTENERALLEAISTKYKDKLLSEIELEKENNNQRKLFDIFSDSDKPRFTPMTTEEEIEYNLSQSNKKKFILALLVDLLNDLSEEFPQLDNMNSTELSELYRALNNHIARRYLTSIDYNKETLLNDAREVLEKYTITDLLKDYRANDKNTRLLYVKLKLKSNKEMLLFETLRNRISLFQSVCIVLSDEIFNTVEAVTNKRFCCTWNAIDCMQLYDEESGVLTDLTDEELEEILSQVTTPISDIPIELLRDFNNNPFDEALTQIEEKRFTELYQEFKKQQERARIYKAERRHKQAQETNKQLSFDDIIGEDESIQKLSETQKQVINPLMNGLARTTPKSRREITVVGQHKNEYKNSIITLTIGMNKNNKLLQLTKNSIPFYFALIAEVVNKYEFKGITDETYPSITIPTREIFELFGKDYDNDTQRYDFLKELKTNSDIWRLASVSANNGKDFYALTSMLTEYVITKDYCTFGFTPKVARTLLDPSYSQFVNLPKAIYKQDNTSWQLMIYLNWQSQMYRNIDNSKSPVRIVDDKYIEIKRSVSSILEAVPNLNSTRVLENDRRHFLREIGIPLEERLHRLTETPLSDENPTPVIIKWSYEGDTSERVRTVEDRNDFATPEEWIETNIIFYLPIPEGFVEAHNNYLTDKAEKKQKVIERNRAKSKAKSNEKKMQELEERLSNIEQTTKQ